MHAIILAAGSSRRFGANKLLSLLNGRPLFSYALENALSCPEITDITVVTRYREIEEYIEKNVDILIRFGQKTISVIHNPFADEGISSSIRMLNLVQLVVLLWIKQVTWPRVHLQEG